MFCVRGLMLVVGTILALSSSAMGSVMIPGFESTSSMAEMKASRPSAFVKPVEGLYGRKSVAFTGYQSSKQPVLAMAIPGYGVAEQVFVGGFGNFLGIFNTVITARILLSWFPQAQSIGALQPLYAVTDPYLNLFRGIIPPIFGLDLSPILAFVTLNLLTSATASVGCELPPGFSEKDNKFSKMVKQGKTNMGVQTSN